MMEEGSIPPGQAAIELAYGLLWILRTDRSTRSRALEFSARRILLGQIGRDGHTRGIEAAKAAIIAGDI